MSLIHFNNSGGLTVAASTANPVPVVQTGTPALPSGASTEAKQPALGVAGTPSADFISVQGIGYTPSVAITRPADVVAYTAGDVVGGASSAIHSFLLSGPAAGRVIVRGSDLRIDLAGVPAGMTSFRLHLYDASPTAILDNAVWDLPAGDRSMYLGYLDLGTPVDVGSTLFVQTDSLAKQLKLAAASTTLFGLLVTNGAYTPTSGEVYTIRLQLALV